MEPGGRGPLAIDDLVWKIILSDSMFFPNPYIILWIGSTGLQEKICH